MIKMSIVTACHLDGYFSDEGGGEDGDPEETAKSASSQKTIMARSSFIPHCPFGT